MPTNAVTAPRSSRLTQSRVKVAASSHRLAQLEHSCIAVVPTETGRMSLLHPGQRSEAPFSSTARAALAPQLGQNSMPANIVPKHDGHATVVSVEPQYSQRVASAPCAGAPHVGQLREEAMP